MSLSNKVILLLSIMCLVFASKNLSFCKPDNNCNQISKLVNQSEISLTSDKKVLLHGKVLGEDCSTHNNVTVELSRLPNGATGFSSIQLDETLFWLSGGCIESNTPLPSNGQNATYFFNRKTKSLVKGPNLLIGRIFHDVFRLPNNEILVIGGIANRAIGNYEKTLEIFSPSTRTIRLAGSLSSGRINMAVLPISNHLLLVVGGQIMGQNKIETNQIEMINLKKNVSTVIGTLIKERQSPCLYRVNNNEVLVYGGWNSNSDNDSSNLPSEIIKLPTNYTECSK